MLAADAASEGATQQDLALRLNDAKRAFLRGFDGPTGMRLEERAPTRFRTTATSGSAANAYAKHQSSRPAAAHPPSAGVSMLSGISALSMHNDDSSTIDGHNNTADPADHVNHTSQQHHSTSRTSQQLRQAGEPSDQYQAVSRRSRSDVAEAISMLAATTTATDRDAPRQGAALARNSAAAAASAAAALTVETRPLTEEEEELLHIVRAMRSEVQGLTRELVDAVGIEHFLEFFDFSAGAYPPQPAAAPDGRQQDADGRTMASSASSIDPAVLAATLSSKEYRARRFAAQQAIKAALLHENEQRLRSLGVSVARPTAEGFGPLSTLPLPPSVKKLRAVLRAQVAKADEYDSAAVSDARAEEAIRQLAARGLLELHEKAAAVSAPRSPPRPVAASDVFSGVSASTVAPAPKVAVNPILMDEELAAMAIGDGRDDGNDERLVGRRWRSEARRRYHTHHQVEDDGDDDPDNFLVNRGDTLGGRDARAANANATAAARRREHAAEHLRHLQAQVMLSHVMHAAATLTDEVARQQQLADAQLHAQQVLVNAMAQNTNRAGAGAGAGSPVMLVTPSAANTNHQDSSNSNHSGLNALLPSPTPVASLFNAVGGATALSHHSLLQHHLSLANQSSLLDPVAGLRSAGATLQQQQQQQQHQAMLLNASLQLQQEQQRLQLEQQQLQLMMLRAGGGGGGGASAANAVIASALKGGRTTPGAASSRTAGSSSGSGGGSSKKTPTFVGVDDSITGGAGGTTFGAVGGVARAGSLSSRGTGSSPLDPTQATGRLGVGTGGGTGGGPTENYHYTQSGHGAGDVSQGVDSSRGDTSSLDDPTRYGFTSRGDLGQTTLGGATSGPGESTIAGGDDDDDEVGSPTDGATGSRAASEGGASSRHSGAPGAAPSGNVTANTTRQSLIADSLRAARERQGGGKKPASKKSGFFSCLRSSDAE